MSRILYVGLDVHKQTVSVTTAEEGRDGPVRFIGTISNTPKDISELALRLGKDGHRLEFCCEAGGCGYGIYRQLTALGHGCTVAAPSLIARKPGDRVKNDRRDSEKLALQHRFGELTPVWVPDPAHEAMRDLVRARMDAAMQLMRARQQCLAFLLRHGRIYGAGHKNWTQRHRQWLATQTFEQNTHQIVFQDYVEAVWAAKDRRSQLEAQIAAALAHWPLAPLVEALRAVRGIDLISSVIFVAAVGDLGRFQSPRQLMATRAARRNHPRGQQRGKAHAGGGGMELPLSAARRPEQKRHPRAPAKARARHRLESAGASVRPLPQALRSRQKAGGGGHRHCARALRLPLGHRKGRQTGPGIKRKPPAVRPGAERKVRQSSGVPWAGSIRRPS
jgi:transposase